MNPLNFIGVNNGQGIRIYVDEAQSDSDVSKKSEPLQAGNGRVVIERSLTDRDELADYVDVDVDELLFFNEKLNHQQIIDIKNMT